MLIFVVTGAAVARHGQPCWTLSANICARLTAPFRERLSGCSPASWPIALTHNLRADAVHDCPGARR